MAGDRSWRKIGSNRSSHERLYPDEQQFDLWTYWADLACHLLLELEIDGCYVIGVDGGARVALHFAGKQAPAHRLAARGVIADSFLADLDSRALHRSLDLREHYYVRNASLLERQHGEDWRQVVDADTAFLRQIADRGGYQVPDFVLNGVACPVLLTGHMQDMRTPGIAHEFARISGIIPDCSICLMSTSGHPYIEFPLMWSDPDSFRAAADRFLDSP